MRREIFKRKRSLAAKRDYVAPAVFGGQGGAERSGTKLFSRLPQKFLPLAGITVVVYLFFFSPKFAIKDVIVEGNEFVAAERIVERVPVGRNIFLFNLADCREDILANLPEIKDVAIYRGIPNAVKLVVLERDGRLIWESNGVRYLVSTGGEVARKILPEEEAGFAVYPRIVDRRNFTVTPGTALVSPNFVSFITNLHEQFFDNTNIKPTFFEIDETTFDVVLHTEAGFSVKFNSMRASRKQLEDLKRVLVAKRPDIREYIDLRIDGWAYYK